MNSEVMAELQRQLETQQASIHDSLPATRAGPGDDELASRQAAVAAEVARINREWTLEMFLPLIPKHSDRSGQPVPEWRRQVEIGPHINTRSRSDGEDREDGVYFVFWPMSS